MEIDCKVKRIKGLSGKVADVKVGSLWVWALGYEAYGEVCMLVRNSGGPGHRWLLVGLLSGTVVQSGESAVDVVSGFSIVGPGGKVTLKVVEEEE